MTQLMSVVRVVVVLTALLGTLISAQADAYQPLMEKTLDLLKQAQDAADPLPLLEQARSTLQNARNNKGGRKQDGLRAIDEAIDIIKGGGDPKGKISHAITMVKSGMSRGKS